MQDRKNTIAGWVLFGGIIALGSSIVATHALKSEAPEHGGYPLEGSTAGEAATTEAEKPIEFYLASADPAKGEAVFKKCTACHNADKGGANALGPNLWDVLGEPIGKGKGFAFSDALAGHGGTWDWDVLSEWLKDPKKFAPGTKMTFAGLSNPQDRANVMAFLNQHSDAPEALPAAPAESAAAPAAGDKAGAPAGANAAAPAEANAAAPAEAPKK